jgi:uncharacterized protein (DUF58 family)
MLCQNLGFVFEERGRGVRVRSKRTFWIAVRHYSLSCSKKVLVTPNFSSNGSNAQKLEHHKMERDGWGEEFRAKLIKRKKV